MTLLDPQFDWAERTHAPVPVAAGGCADIEDREAAGGLAASGLADWRPVLHALGVTPEQASAIAADASRNGVAFHAEIAASGLVDERALTEALAKASGIAFLRAFDAEALLVRPTACIALLRARRPVVVTTLRRRDGNTLILVATDQLGPEELRQLRRKTGAAAGRVRLVAPGDLRAALLRRARPMLTAIATRALAERLPHYSARVVANGWQGTVLGAVVIGLPMLAAFRADLAFGALHAFSSLFFLSCVALRVAALAAPVPATRPVALPGSEADLPVYSVLVALHREASIVPDLIANLQRLVWPRHKLDVKLICEADDVETLAAIETAGLPPCFEVVRVPPSAPRTKPKALGYALPLARGEFVVLYDAEDEPHPLQLVEAWERFSASGPELACLQAPLEVVNAQDGPIARLFAFEYAALFRVLLPFLSRYGGLLPLGGTSNHFRREVLEEVGGWDPYNVTEDADLGLRLARFGYRSATISLPTRETGPSEFGIWLRQRTRWFKGWAQTWLVHMRRPMVLRRELGTWPFLLVQVLFAGMIASSLVHPVLVLSAFWLAGHLLLDRPLETWQSVLLAVDVVNIACGYASFLLLGRQALSGKERRGFWRVLALTPVYWMMLSLAAWRSIHQLWARPYHWEKTPHRPWRRKPHRDDPLPASG